MIRRVQTIGAAVAFVVASAVSVPAQQFSPGRDLQLSFNADGTVNLTARNVSAREILVEWARRCQCHVVNADRLTGGAIMLPLQFENAQQTDVLRSLLRSAAGYVLTPQRPGVQSASRYETIYILATSNPVAGAYVPPPTPQAMPMPTAGNPDDELPPLGPAPNQPGAAPQHPGPTQTPPSSASPFGSRSTSSPFVTITPAQESTTAPGTVAPAPSAPGMPVQQNTAPAPYQAPPPQQQPRPGTVVPIVPVQATP